MSRLFSALLLSSLLGTCAGESSVSYPDLWVRHLSMQPDSGMVDHTAFLWTAVVNNPDEAPELSLIFYSEESDRHWREEMQLHSEDTPFLYSLELEFGQPGYYEYQLVVDLEGHRELGEVQSFWVDEESLPSEYEVNPVQHEGGDWSLRLPMQNFSELPRVDLLWLDPIAAEVNRQSFWPGSTGGDFLFYTNLNLPDPTTYLVWTEVYSEEEVWLSSVEEVQGH